jgi:hypothetical protein
MYAVHWVLLVAVAMASHPGACLLLCVPALLLLLPPAACWRAVGPSLAFLLLAGSVYVRYPRASIHSRERGTLRGVE